MLLWIGCADTVPLDFWSRVRARPSVAVKSLIELLQASSAALTQCCVSQLQIQLHPVTLLADIGPHLVPCAWECDYHLSSLCSVLLSFLSVLSDFLFLIPFPTLLPSCIATPPLFCAYAGFLRGIVGRLLCGKQFAQVTP